MVKESCRQNMSKENPELIVVFGPPFQLSLNAQLRNYASLKGEK